MPDPNYLTPEELKTLTGRSQSAKQLAWLARDGWVFAVGDDGRPKVFRAYHDARMSGKPQMENQPAYGVFRGRKTQAA